jgi:hypothetical protein
MRAARDAAMQNAPGGLGSIVMKTAQGSIDA